LVPLWSCRLVFLLLAVLLLVQTTWTAQSEYKELTLWHDTDL
jgi:hypothetical protein